MRPPLLALLATLSSCKCNSAEPEHKPIGGSPKGGTAALVDKPNYRIDIGPGTPCKANDACTARVVLTALGNFHVNEKYPTKLVADPTPGIAVTEATFVLDSAKAGTLTIPFRATRPGTYKITGTFKICVCTEKDCEVESPKITFEVTAT